MSTIRPTTGPAVQRAARGEYVANPDRVRNMDVGVERVARWRIDDEAHLPKDRSPAPKFIPDPGKLDDILRRPSLDERLPSLLKPDRLDETLLHPPVLSATRESVARRFRAMERGATGADRAAFREAAEVLEVDAALDGEVRAALAALLRA